MTPAAAEPGSFAERYYVVTRSRGDRRRRDVRLLGYLLALVWRWCWNGRRVRAAYRRAQRERRPYLVDGGAP